MKAVIPDDFPPVYQNHPQIARLQQRGDVAVYSTRAASTAELVDRLSGAEIAINVRAYTKFDADLLAILPDLRMVSILGTGTDNFDLTACTNHGVVVTNTPGASTTAVAELTFGLLLAVARHLALTDRMVRDGTWYHEQGFELRGKVLGVVGLGLIGQEVARLGKAFGMSVIAWSFHQDPARAQALGAELVSLDELLRQSDVVSIHLRNSAEARGMIGKREIGLLKPASVLINTARAAIVDQDALLEALQEKRLAGAGLDVFLQEPMPADNPWIKLDNVVLSPHGGTVTREATERLARAPIDNIFRYLDGEPTSVVNAKALEHPRQKRV